ncbi:MAG: hypothetical protein GFH27_549309n122 [Chloroflexi bacterium AL-W]|nr:hypothetical protein [Chloroflexi bacterium AL-N1]NOK69824.1 hypothetical protein [Chloroflexi bacterium AL-N10]NOK73572.1 hypothetical protein [Chloroflexi bacterium AL-N5]NOK83994.1 hypothetical protein [Chloroflexi bacterium AL-W]NOK87903.1 hypothetical protein [Chloroflexi bacterium AL-N15]
MQIGVVLSIEGNEQAGIPYRTVRDLALQAEQAGFDSLWLYDHLLFRSDESTAGQWECFTFLAALAEATECITLGTLVACTAFRNPALTAKIATALDEVSNGRFVLGLGAGWNEAEFHAFGLPFDHRVARFEEAVKIITPLVREGKVDFTGTYERAPDCMNIPRGPSPSGPPILVGAFGPRMVRIAAQYADYINTSYPDEEAEQRWTMIEATRNDAGQTTELKISTPMWVAFDDLGTIPPHMAESRYQSAEAVAARLRQLDALGTDHVMIDFRPNHEASLTRISEALKLYRES